MIGDRAFTRLDEFVARGTRLLFSRQPNSDREVARAGTRETMGAVVTELRPLGAFATWQAERAAGDHDRNTVRLRLDPRGDPTGLEPGMTVWIAH
jgi:hypothetical protein